MEKTPRKKTQDLTRLQGWLAVASFTVGTLIAIGSLFLVPPPGEISSSAISIVSEFLVLAGALLGIKTGFDVKMQRFESEVDKRIRRGVQDPPNFDDHGEF